MSHKYSKSYFHDSEQLRRFVDDHKDRFTLSANGHLVEIDFHIAVKINVSLINNGCTYTSNDTAYSEVDSKVNGKMYSKFCTDS